MLEFDAPCGEPVPPSCEGDGTFAGTVAGVPGTFSFEVEGDNCDLMFQLEIEEGTGLLEDLEGELTFGPPVGFDLPYSGEIEFDG